MKNITLLTSILLLSFGQLFSQVPMAFNYQAIARDASGNPIANRIITTRLSINQGLSPGAPEYVETHSSTTNQFGLLTLKIGTGAIEFGTFSAIQWNTANTYISVEIDETGGSSYHSMGTTQLLSVPYALYAGKVAGDTGTGSVTPNNSWAINGNTNTTGTNFIGTINNQNLEFRINNQKAGIIENTSNNTALGFNTLNSNLTGSTNSAFGHTALYSNLSGYSNVAIGAAALYSNFDRNNTVAIGDSTLYFNGVGTYKPSQAIRNTALGSKALFLNTLGSSNTSVGFSALFANTIGEYNTAVGTFALIANINGTGNTAIGLDALTSNINGENNTAIGYAAFISGDSFNNSTAIGYNANIDASNQIRIGNSSVTSIGSQAGWTTYSDGRIKNNVQENVPGLSFITALRPVTYHYDVNKENKLAGKTEGNNWPGKYDIEKFSFSGFIAQEVEATAKQIGYDFSGVDKSGHIWGIRYAEFVPSLVKGMQEQQLLIETLTQQLNELKSSLKIEKAAQ